MKKWEMVVQFLVNFLKKEFSKRGFKKAVLGLSGGLDSAVVACLAKKAFGDNLLCVIMPSQYSCKKNIEDALVLCKNLNLRYEQIPITNLVQHYCDGISSQLRVGNFSARMRMSILYDISARENALVLGTSNKSELLLGYGTLHGDLAYAVNALGDIYKTDVYMLAKELNITNEIINKPPSADLFYGQKDEDDLGFTYTQIDKALLLYVEKKVSKEELISLNIELELINMIVTRIHANKFKQQLPVIAKLTNKGEKYERRDFIS